jgi:hypothetical protein
MYNLPSIKGIGFFGLVFIDKIYPSLTFFWRQRAKIHRLKEGDLHTQKFHMSTTTTLKVKKIEKLKNDDN